MYAHSKYQLIRKHTYFELDTAQIFLVLLLQNLLNLLCSRSQRFLRCQKLTIEFVIIYHWLY